MRQAEDAKADIARQAPSLLRNSDARYSCGYRSLKHKESRNGKTLRLRRIISLPWIIIVQMPASLARLWVSFQKKILISGGYTSKANLLTPWYLAATLLSPKINSKTTEVWIKSNTLLATKMTTLPVNALAKSQKTSVSCDNLCINKWG